MRSHNNTNGPMVIISLLEHPHRSTPRNASRVQCSRSSPQMLSETVRPTSHHLERRWNVEGKFSAKLSSPGAHSTNVLGMVPLLDCLRPTECLSVSNPIINLMAKHILSGGYLSMNRQLRMDSRQIRTPKQSSIIPDLNPPTMVSGFLPQTIKPFKCGKAVPLISPGRTQDTLSLHPL